MSTDEAVDQIQHQEQSHKLEGEGEWGSLRADHPPTVCHLCDSVKGCHLTITAGQCTVWYGLWYE